MSSFQPTNHLFALYAEEHERFAKTTKSEIIQELQQGTRRAAIANDIGIESFLKIIFRLLL